MSVETPASPPPQMHQGDQTILPVPDSERIATPVQQFWIWSGANIAPVNWVLGALGVSLWGLSPWQAIGVVVIGNAIGMTMFGLFTLMGQSTGVTQMILTRSAFGRRGAYLPAAFQVIIAAGWVGFNTWIVLDVSAAILSYVGIDNSVALQVLIVAFVMVLQVGLAMLGFKAIQLFEKWTVPVTLAVLAVMTVVAWRPGGKVDWGMSAVVTGSDQFAAMTQMMTAIGIGWGITWLAYASDYSRFVPRSVPRRRLFLASSLGQFIPVVWLAALGASMATVDPSSDPAVLIVSNFGALALPVLLLVLHAPVATNILNLYSTSVSVLALDIRVTRRLLSLIAGLFATVFTYFLVWQTEHGSTLGAQVSAWLSGLVAWVSPWAAIMLIHFYLKRRGVIDVPALFAPASEGRLPVVNWAAVAGFLLGLVAAWSCLYAEPAALQGPIAKQLGGVDLSWLTGMSVASVVYLVLSRLLPRSAGGEARTAPASRPGGEAVGAGG